MIKENVISASEIRARARAGVLTAIASFVVLGIKAFAYNVSGSQSIYSDALESIVNVITAIVGIIVIYYASKPADEDHPYGHGKIEYFSSVFEGGLITFAAVAVFMEVFRAQVNQEPLRDLNRGLFYISIAGAINLLLGFYLKNRGEKYASMTLVSAGTHLLIDFWTTLGAITGVLVVYFTGLIWVDRVVAVLLGIYMGYSGFKLVRQSIAGLLDAEDIKILSKLARLFENHSGRGIIQIHHTKVIRSGWFHHIDAHVVVPEFWSIDEAHERLEEFEKNVIGEYEYGGEANFHLDPCKRSYCEVCDYATCGIREKPFKKRIPVVIEDLRSREEPDQYQS